MNGLIIQLLAALAALSAAIGTPVDTKKMPDRPAIAQSAPAAGSVKGAPVNSSKNAPASKPNDDASKPANKAQPAQVEITGAISNIVKGNGSTTVTIGNQNVIVNSSTKVEGTLVTGANAKIEASKQADGSLVASEVEVKPTGVSGKSSNSNSSSHSNDDKSKDDKSEDHSNDDGHDDKSGDDKSDDKSGDDKSDDKSGSGSSNDGSGHH